MSADSPTFVDVEQVAIRRVHPALRLRRLRTRARLVGRQLVTWSWRLVPLALVLLCAAGIAVRLLVQDAFGPRLAAFYYATPPVVLAGVALFAGLLWLARRQFLVAAITLGLSATCGVWTWSTAWFDNTPLAITDTHRRVVFWNAARGARGWDNVAHTVLHQDADLIALAESGANLPKMNALWRQILPDGYRYVVFGSGLTLIAKADITPVASGRLHATYGWYEHSVLHFDDDPVHVVIVDIKSNPMRARWIPLEALQDVLEPLAGQPVIVLGDFNTPTDSIHLASLRQHYRNAFEIAGQGYAATWPLPLPVLAIDHIWVSNEIAAAACEMRSTTVSDHRMVIAELTW